MKKWLIIANLASGGGKGKKDWGKIESLLNSSGIQFDVEYTQKRVHAREIAMQSVAKGYRNFISMGGDGTLNEITDGLFSQTEVPTNEITIGIIPVGTGNDWAKTWSIPADFKSAIDIIKKGKTYVQDIGKVSFMENGEKKYHHFINMAGVAYDAYVTLKTNDAKDAGQGGKLFYLLNILKHLFSYKDTLITYKIDGKEYKSMVFNMVAGICRFNGDGMMQAPNAIPGDGLLDVTVIGPMNKFKMILNMPNLMNGTFIKNKEVTTYQCKTLEVNSEPPIMLETDGESLGYSPFSFTVIPRSLNVVIGKEPA